MKTHEIVTYTIGELKEKFPDSYKLAIEKYRNDSYEYESPFVGEIFDSLKKILSESGISLKDWDIGAYGYNRINIEFSNEETKILSGGRAMAWLENNLLLKLRDKMGKLKSCPFTGICYDDILIENLILNVKKGMYLHDAYCTLAYDCGKLIREEIEFENKEENIFETLEVNDYEFTSNGKMF